MFTQSFLTVHLCHLCPGGIPGRIPGLYSGRIPKKKTWRNPRNILSWRIPATNPARNFWRNPVRNSWKNITETPRASKSWRIPGRNAWKKCRKKIIEKSQKELLQKFWSPRVILKETPEWIPEEIPEGTPWGNPGSYFRGIQKQNSWRNPRRVFWGNP